MISFAVISDDRAFRLHIGSIADARPGLTCTARSRKFDEALVGIALARTDVVLLDAELQGVEPDTAIRALSALTPPPKVIVVATYPEQDLVFSSFRAGARGFLKKRASRTRIMKAMREVNAGGAPMSKSVARSVVKAFRNPVSGALTMREEQVLMHLIRGQNSRVISKSFQISEETVRIHIKSICRKLQTGSTSAAVAVALRQGLTGIRYRRRPQMHGASKLSGRLRPSGAS